MCKDVKYSVKYLGRISIKRYVHPTYGVMEMDDQISISRFAFPTERKKVNSINTCLVLLILKIEISFKISQKCCM